VAAAAREEALAAAQRAFLHDLNALVGAMDGVRSCGGVTATAAASGGISGSGGVSGGGGISGGERCQESGAGVDQEVRMAAAGTVAACRVPSPPMLLLLIMWLL
jgi:hypothetical protein